MVRYTDGRVLKGRRDEKYGTYKFGCYAGARGEETPRRFTLENRLVEIRRVVDQWRTPDHRYFKVRTAAGETYTLRQDVRSGVWEVTECERTC